MENSHKHNRGLSEADTEPPDSIWCRKLKTNQPMKSGLCWLLGDGESLAWFLYHCIRTNVAADYTGMFFWWKLIELMTQYGCLSVFAFNMLQ